MNNSVFRKTYGECKEAQRLQTPNKWWKNNSSSGTAKLSHKEMVFRKQLLAIEMNKTEVKMNKPVYLGLLIQDIS